MAQKLLVDCFEWENSSKFTSDFIKNYDEKSSTVFSFFSISKSLHYTNKQIQINLLKV